MPTQVRGTKRNQPARARQRPNPAAATSFAGFGLLIFASALAIRGAHLWAMRHSPFFHVLLGDAKGYDAWALQIAGGDWVGRDVFYQAPLYAYFLGSISWVRHSLVLVRVCQAVVGAAGCALLAHAAAQLFGRSAGIAAGLILAVYAPAVFFDGLVQKSVLDVFLVCALLAMLSRPIAEPDHVGSRWRWLGIGAMLGALSLTRENALIFIPILIGWMFWRPERRRRQSAALFVAGLSLMLLPVALRNLVVGGEFHLTTTQSGPNFFIGNHAGADGTYVPLRFGRGSPEYERVDATELASQAAGRALSPGDVSSYWTRRAVDYIRANPLDWLALEGRKLRLLFNSVEVMDTESQESYEDESPPLRVLAHLAHFGVLLPLACVGIWLTWAERRRLWVLHVMAGAYVLSVLAFYVVARYRLPLVPFLIVFASAAVARGRTVFAGRTPRRTVAGMFAMMIVTLVVNRPVVSADSMRAATFQNLGASLQEDGRLDEAAAAFDRALSLDPRYAAAHNSLSAVLRQQGKLDQAIDHFEEARRLRADFDTVEMRSNLGVALAGAHRLDEAIEQFRAAAALAPHAAKPRYNLGHTLLTRGDLAQAVEQLARAVALDPLDVPSRYELGNAYLARHQAMEAVEQFREVARLSPQLVEGHNNLGIALGSLGRLDEAIEEFRTARRIDPRSSEAEANLRSALAAQRTRDRSRQR